MQNQQRNQAIEALLRQQELNKPNGMGIAGFILSLVSLLTVWISIISMISIIFFFVSIIHMIILIAGLVTSIIGMKRPKKGFAVAGLIISIVVILIYIIMVIGTSSFLYSLSTGAFSLEN